MGFIANRQVEGVSGWKITKRNLVRYQELGRFLLNWFGSLLAELASAGQGQKAKDKV